jgi:putative transposase
VANSRSSWTGSKKKLELPTEAKRGLIEPAHPRISIARQCQLVGLPRASWYYQPTGGSWENLQLMRLLDEQYTRTPFYGVRRMTAWLKAQGHVVHVKRVARLRRVRGLEAIYPKPRTSQRAPEHRVYPYVLRGLSIRRVKHVWSTDITYMRLHSGFIYWVAVLDWCSRYVVSGAVSLTWEVGLCVEALERALEGAQPEIFNSDQGAQLTSLDLTSRLEAAGIQISRDGRGRALDNIFVERLWRTVKYEEVSLNDDKTPKAAVSGLKPYFDFYNRQRLHQALAYQTPATVYFGG